MTAHQITLVKHSWRIFQSIDPVLIGDVFYSKLFIAHPRLESLFKIPIPAQSKKLIEMLNMIVGRLNRLDELSEDIRQLAIRHVDYGVKPDHYAAVGDALLWTLEQGLGKDWNAEVREAWSTCFSMLAQTMITASERKFSL